MGRCNERPIHALARRIPASGRPTQTKASPMKLFSKEFTRFFALGFLGGAALIGTSVIGHDPVDMSGAVAPPASAAPVLQAK